MDQPEAVIESEPRKPASLRTGLEMTFVELFESNRQWRHKCGRLEQEMATIRAQLGDRKASLTQIVGDKKETERRIKRMLDHLEDQSYTQMHLSQLQIEMVQLKEVVEVDRQKALAAANLNEDRERRWQREAQKQREQLKAQHEEMVRALEDDYEHSLASVERQWQARWQAKKETLVHLKEVHADKLGGLEEELANVKRKLKKLQENPEDPAISAQRKVEQMKAVYEAKLMTSERHMKHIQEDQLRELKEKIAHWEQAQIEDEAGDRVPSSSRKKPTSSIVANVPNDGASYRYTPSADFRSAKKQTQPRSGSNIHPAFEEPTVKKKRVSFDRNTSFVEHNSGMTSKPPPSTPSSPWNPMPKKPGPSVRSTHNLGSLLSFESGSLSGQNTPSHLNRRPGLSKHKLFTPKSGLHAI